MPKLGLLVNSARHLEQIAGLTRAAIARGHSVAIFVMDEGTRLLGENPFAALADLDGVAVSVCEHSAKTFGVATGQLPASIRCGSQLNNAMMVHKADRVVVL